MSSSDLCRSAGSPCLICVVFTLHCIPEGTSRCSYLALLLLFSYCDNRHSTRILCTLVPAGSLCCSSSAASSRSPWGERALPDSLTTTASRSCSARRTPTSRRWRPASAATSTTATHVRWWTAGWRCYAALLCSAKDHYPALRKITTLLVLHGSNPRLASRQKRDRVAMYSFVHGRG